MIDYQTVQQPYNIDNPVVHIYRCEYDERTHRGLDRFGKADEYYRRTGQGEFIQDGVTLVLDKELNTLDDMYRFFGFEKNEQSGGRRTSGYHLKVCFDHYGRLIIFKRDLGYEPEQFIKQHKNRTRIWTKWTPKSAQFWIHSKRPGIYTTWGWTFKRPEDYLVFSISPWKLNCLIPEKNLCSLCADEAFAETLWNVGIVDLSESWVTPESEAEVERLYELRKKRGDI